ncbi:RabGAP/TBC [Xylariomycetidae sp. FL0641]|nr:RabGAP/TBC [Xylariomycetidae sp. FL0641]
MRSLVDATTRWQETLKHSSSLAELQQAVKNNGADSPCIVGCRSVCWKAFLLAQTASTTNWSHALLESRSTYSSLRDHFLKYIKHPEYLTAATADPLADDADSPWNTLRADETLRAEILQDVQRLPDEPFYHQPHIQDLILDVLFIYCKLNPDVGGYRQGMHELLAPIVYVIEQDAIDPVDAASDASADLRMVEMLDASFIEHDAFALFTKLMESAKAFYEVPDPTNSLSMAGQSSIVEKSQHIHEVCLYKVDPQLSNHLKDIEILPQVFLIRWIRLLCSREFPFDQLLILWDTLFSVDPSFQLIDLVCTAMMVRIRWELLEADYTYALQLLLKYPPPEAPNGPHTFIDDAAYLRDHLDPNGGAALIIKYTGRPPTSSGSQPGTPTRSLGASMRERLGGARSPLSPSRFKAPQGGVEALFQGAAKGVFERGEKLGINQAVRDAMVEIRRNVQEAKSSIKTSGRDLFTELPNNNNNNNNHNHTTAVRAVALLDARNRRLAAMLDESIAGLHALGTSEADLADKTKTQTALEVAAARLQFVKVHLEDSTLSLPGDEEEEEEEETLDTAMAVDSPLPEPAATGEATPRAATSPPTAPSSSDPTAPAVIPDAAPDPLSSSTSTGSTVPPQRPQPPIPTRSTLAQSSFSWMLEPDQSPSSLPGHHTLSSASSSSSVFASPPPPPPLSGASANPGKRPSANANRERTAFLFGEVPADAGGGGRRGGSVTAGDIFGLEPLTKGK